MNLRRLAFGLLLAALSAPAFGQVVINEIFYHAPDDLRDLAWVELFNNSDQAVDLSGWRLHKGIQYRFPAGSTISSHGFLVLCQNRERFQEFYSVPVAGLFENSLKKSGGRVELRNAEDRMVDSVSFTDHSPWPRGPAGHTASLERICPGAPGNLAENWIGSPLSEDETKPGGTPGKQNSGFCPTLPPVISNVSFRPELAEPDQAIEVQAQVSGAVPVSDTVLLYQVVGPGSEGVEQTIPMKASAGRYSATIPGQRAGQIVRFRIQATDAHSARRVFPSPTDLHPALSCLVFTNVPTGKIPVGYIVHTDAAEVQSSENQRQNGGPPTNPEGQARFMVQMGLDNLLGLGGLWADLTFGDGQGTAHLGQLRSLFARKTAEAEQLKTSILASKDLQGTIRKLPEMVKPFRLGLGKEIEPLLTADQVKEFERWRDGREGGGGPMEGGDPAAMLRQFIRLEPAYLHLALSTNLTSAQFAAVREIYRSAMQERAALIPTLRKLMAAGPNGAGAEGEDLQTKAMAIEPGVDEKLRGVLTTPQARQFALWRQADAPAFMRRGGPKPVEPVLGKSAFVFVDPKARRPKLFDFVHIPNRSGGWKVHFDKDAALNGITGIDLIFESSERWVLAEPLAYEFHHRAGLAAPLTDFVRLWVDGQPLGYYLLIEQPNKAFLRRNGLHDDGNLYKANYTGNGLTGQNEKRTNLHSSHDDLVGLVDGLERTASNPAEQWEVIKRELNVEEVVNHYAVRMLISDWDGFFNNYYLYHDLHGTGKWTFYPWDEDKTWGEYDGWDNRPLFDLPLSYGSETDRPPGSKPGAPAPRGIMGGSWWRPGGYISRPVLANSEFRKLLLARMKELLGTEFRDDRLFPYLDAMKERLSEEVQFRAEVRHEDRDQAQRQLEANIASFKEFISKRRQWLMAQEEIRAAGPFDRSQLPAVPDSSKKAKRSKPK